MKPSNVILFILLGVFAFQGVPSAFAHERRSVAEKYEFVAGFLNEPAFSGAMNGLDLRVTQNDAPVEGLEKTLKAAVRYENQKETLQLPLKARHKQPGAYAGYFFPVKPGKYSFEISGEINGQAVKEIFKPGEKFHSIQDPEALKWPKSRRSK